MGRGRREGEAVWRIRQTPLHFRASRRGRDGQLRPPAGPGRCSRAPAYSSARLPSGPAPSLAGAQSGRREGGNDPGTRGLESLRGWSLGPPPPLLSLRLSALAGRHLTPPWLERPAEELASCRCLASWTPSSSCLFRDANGVKLRKFAKRGAAGAPRQSQHREIGGGMRGKPRQLGLGSRVADSPSHLPIPHSCSAGTGRGAAQRLFSGGAETACAFRASDLRYRELRVQHPSQTGRPCPGRLAGKEGKTLPYICSDREQVLVPPGSVLLSTAAGTGCSVLASGSKERSGQVENLREEASGI